MANPKVDSPIKLDLRLIEADQVMTPVLLRQEADLLAIDGIMFDQHGNPTEYHVLKRHPGDNMARWTFDFDRVPAASMIHYFRAERPGQNRGIPEITPALPLFAQLRRYTLAVLAAAETAADFAAVLYTDAPANGEAADVEPMDLVELERRMATVLPGGWRLGQIQAEQPSTTYGEFKKEILNEIARCLNMPFNVACGNQLGLQLRLRPAGSPDLLQVDPRRPGPVGAGGSRPRAAGLARRGDPGERLPAALDADGRLPRPAAPVVLGRAGARRSGQGGQRPGDAADELHHEPGLRIRPAGPRLGKRNPPAGQGTPVDGAVGAAVGTARKATASPSNR